MGYGPVRSLTEPAGASHALLLFAIVRRRKLILRKELRGRCSNAVSAVTQVRGRQSRSCELQAAEMLALLIASRRCQSPRRLWPKHDARAGWLGQRWGTRLQTRNPL